MRNKLERFILYIFTFFIDIFLIYILINKKINNYDYYYIAYALFIHLIFYISIFYNYRFTLDICHWFLLILLILSIFIKNTTLMYIPLGILVIIPTLWLLFDNRCILSTDEQNNNGYFSKILGIDLSKIIYILIIILILKIKKIIK